MRWPVRLTSTTSPGGCRTPARAAGPCWPRWTRACPRRSSRRHSSSASSRGASVSSPTRRSPRCAASSAVTPRSPSSRRHRRTAVIHSPDRGVDRWSVRWQDRGAKRTNVRSRWARVGALGDRPRGGLAMTSADPAWPERASVEGPPTGLSVGVPERARRESVGPLRRVRADAADTADLAEQVRLRVRDAGVDPQRDAAAVRRIAESVAQAHDERSLTGAVAPLDDLPALVDDLVARVAGFGPLQRYLDDPSVEEVWINDPSRVFVARHGRHELTPTILTGDEVRELVERMLKTSGRRLDLSQPFVDALLPGGHRLHVVLEGISRDFVAVNIRKFVARAHNLEDLVTLGTLNPRAAAFLRATVIAGLNVVVSGGTQAGKTTLLNCLAAAIPGADRVVSAEEVFELKFAHPDWVAMQTRQAGLEGTGEIRLRELVKQALRMRPSRIIVGEVRAEECLDLLLALNAGLPGMASIHANSAREALVKMCTLPLLAGENIGSRFVVPTVASSVDLVVHLSIDVSGMRRIDEIVAVPGRVENDLIETEPMFVRDDERLRRLAGMPPRPERFARRGIDLRRLLGGEPADDTREGMPSGAGAPTGRPA